MVVTNNGTTAINGWTVTWTFPGDQKISNGWSATISQSGSAVTATNPSYAATIAPGGTASFGFTATYQSSNANPPRSLRLRGDDHDETESGSRPR